MARKFYQSPRERIIDRLRAVGLLVRYSDIWCAEGAHRRIDCARWGVVGVKPCTPLRTAGYLIPFHAHSWDTMTKCAMKGIEIQIDGAEIEIFALT